MKQIFIVNPKGGCGKTTISVQLAAYLANNGNDVLLVDHDALKCSTDWLSGRDRRLAKINGIAAEVGEKISAGDAQWLVHDMPAAWTLDNVEEILHPTDKVIIPVLSSPNDIKAFIRLVMKLHRSGVLESGIQAGIVANKVRVNTYYINILRAFLKRLDLPVIATLRDTQNYVRAMDRGLTIFDIPHSKSRIDIQQWQPLLQWLDIQ